MTKNKLSEWRERFDRKIHREYLEYSYEAYVSLVKDFISQEFLNLIEWVDKKLIGKDEEITIVSYKYETDTDEIKKTVGDDEERWKMPRNELRQEQRQLLDKKRRSINEWL
jgi:hypothetical protein